MTNITKNLLLALTLVCVIALIVFCVQLIVLNRGMEPRENGMTTSGGVQQGDKDPNSEAHDEEPPNGEGGDGGDNDESGFAQNTPRPPPQGERHQFLVVADTNLNLVIYVREELFDFEEGEIDWQFIYSGGGNAALEISFVFVSAQGIAADAETFLNNYTGGETSLYVGEESIKDSRLRGYHVSAVKNGERYEAWIHALPNSDLALVFVINYQNDQQRDALYEILSTLDFA